MRKGFVVIATGVLVVLSIQSGLSQQADDCPALVVQTLTNMQNLCQNAERNQACYANYAIDAVPRSTAEPFSFELGDSRALDLFESLRLSPLDEDANEWGVALLRVQANLPDTLPGQNATILVFGDSELTPLPTGDGTFGQAFQIRTGIGRINCRQTPTDGLIVQTPQGTRRVALTLNGVDISMGSTVLFTANPENGMTITTLQGAAYAQTEYGDTLVIEGSEATIPLDEDFQPNGEPQPPISYDFEQVADLPLDALDDPVDPAEPATDEEVQEAIDAVESGDEAAILDTMDRYEDEDAWFDDGEVIATLTATATATNTATNTQVATRRPTSTPTSTSTPVPTDTPFPVIPSDTPLPAATSTLAVQVSFTAALGYYCSVSFTNTSVGAVSFQWDFGDGGISTEVSPTYTYESCNTTYDVMLKGDDGLGHSQSVHQTIDVIYISPPTDTPIGTPDVTQEPIPMALSFSVVGGPNFLYGDVQFSNTSTGGVTYWWDFGDGGTSTETSPMHTYSLSGTYTVTLSGQDAGGTIQSISQDIPVMIIMP